MPSSYPRRAREVRSPTTAGMARRAALETIGAFASARAIEAGSGPRLARSSSLAWSSATAVGELAPLELMDGWEEKTMVNRASDPSQHRCRIWAEGMQSIYTWLVTPVRFPENPVAQTMLGMHRGSRLGSAGYIALLGSTLR